MTRPASPLAIKAAIREEALRVGFDAVGFMVDCPPADQADPSAYLNVIEEFTAALPGAGTRAAVISS